MKTRFAIVRVPTSGPPALIAAPSIFEDRAAAENRVREIEEKQLKGHHTYLDIVAFDGSLDEMLTQNGYLR